MVLTHIPNRANDKMTTQVLQHNCDIVGTHESKFLFHSIGYTVAQQNPAWCSLHDSALPESCLPPAKQTVIAILWQTQFLLHCHH